MDQQSPMIVLTSTGQIFIFPVSDFIEALKHKNICLNCRHFVQIEDWREEPMGFHLPKGECRCQAPSVEGFPQLHGGKSCGEFAPNAGAIEARRTQEPHKRDTSRDWQQSAS